MSIRPILTPRDGDRPIVVRLDGGITRHTVTEAKRLALEIMAQVAVIEKRPRKSKGVAK